MKIGHHSLAQMLPLFFPCFLASQGTCDIPATIIAGAGCNLVYANNTQLLPCSAPTGLQLLPVGTPLHISYFPMPCVSICLQGMEVKIECAQVDGGALVELCEGQSAMIGDPPLAGEAYQWAPLFYLECDTCAVATVEPPSDAIYWRTTTFPDCPACPQEVIYYNVQVSPCSDVEAAETIEIKCWPVPASEFLYIEGFAFEKFTMYDVYGQMRLSGITNSATAPIDVRALEHGIYLLHLHSKSGDRVVKIVKATP